VLIRNNRLPILATGVLLLLGLALFYTHLATQFQQLFPPCVFFAMTGLHCPGCGSTRAVYALLHLDLARAIHMNALLVLIGLPILGLLSLETILGRLILSSRAHKIMCFGFLLITIVFSIARNIPHYPFILLAPY
jgi:hypothetical protein